MIATSGRIRVFAILALLAGCSTGDARRDATPEPETPSGWYREITTEVGLDFRHDPGIDGSKHMPEIAGSGGAMLDYDGDGDIDVYLVDSGPHDGSPRQESGGSRLFRQNADGRFEDVTPISGLRDTGYGMGCAVGDIDNDGDPDLYVTNVGADTLYRNNGDGTFTDVTATSGIQGHRWSTSAVFFDFDVDGDLDLYVASYVSYSPPKACRDVAGRLDYCGPSIFSGVPDVLYRNEGAGRFTDVSGPSGIASVAGKGLGVYAGTFDADALEDVYVANDGEENQLWINRGKGSFEDQAMLLGVAVNMQGRPEASMGIAVGDVDSDGDLDLFMTHLDRETNTFYESREGRWFEDRSADSGLGASSLPFTGFGTAFTDADHDGDLDLVIVNGRVRRGLEAAVPAEPGDDPFLGDYAEPDLLFENGGSGRFTPVTDRAGSFGAHVEVGRSLIHGDVDGDGDEDLLVTNCNGSARLHFNEVGRNGRWLKIRAYDPDLRRDAIGALVTVEAAGTRQVRHVTRTASYLASREAVVHFGLGEADHVDRILVRWPGGRWEDFPSVEADRSIRLNRGEGRAVEAPAWTPR